MMPQRPQSHILESESEKNFKNLIPNSWVIREIKPDYGIDFQIEIFKNQEATGIFFNVQLKATSKKSLKSALNISIKQSTWNYYQKQETPTMIIVYHQHTSSFYGEFSFNLKTKNKNEKVCFSLHEENLLNQNSFFELEKELEALKNFHKNEYYSPLIYNLFIEKSLLNHINIFNIFYKINEYCLCRGILIEIKREGFYKKASHIKIDEESISVLTAGKNRITLMDVPIKKITEEVLISDILIMLFVSFGKIKGEDLFEFIVPLLKKTSFIKSPDLFSFLMNAFLEKKLVNEIVKIAYFISVNKSLIDPMLMVQLALSISKIELKANQIINLIKISHKFVDAFSQKQPYEAGLISYNMGRYCLSLRRYRDSLAFYKKASRYNPTYQERDYFYAEIGLILYLSNHYRFSIKAFEKINLPLEYSTIYARALTYDGDFITAYKEFEKYFSLEIDYKNKKYIFLEHIICVDYIFYVSLGWLINYLNISKNISNKEKADKKIKKALTTTLNALERKELLINALKLDTLNNWGWINLGYVLVELEEFPDARMCFIMAGLCMLWDDEAWLNAIKISFKINEVEKGCHIIHALAILHADTFKKVTDNLIKVNSIENFPFYEKWKEAILDFEKKFIFFPQIAPSILRIPLSKDGKYLGEKVIYSDEIEAFLLNLEEFASVKE